MNTEISIHFVVYDLLYINSFVYNKLGNIVHKSQEPDNWNC